LSFNLAFVLHFGSCKQVSIGLTDFLRLPSARSSTRTIGCERHYRAGGNERRVQKRDTV
jgi:hypothetical protein